MSIASKTIAPSTPKDTNPLLFRRQFILGPRSFSGFDEWSRLTIGKRLHLAVHPDLNIARIQTDSAVLTLLGFLIDPFHRNRNNSEILERIGDGADTESEIFARTEGLGGRWILIAESDGFTNLFHDPAGLRQVVYFREPEGKLWCATQPGILNEVRGLEIDPQGIEFTQSDYYRNERQSWWPGDATRYTKVRHLLPNHYLDLESGAARRYWPNKPLEKKSLTTGVAEGTQLMEGLMTGAAARFPLALGMTAGWDSRLLLATSRQIAKEIYFCRFHYELNKRSNDILLSRRLMEDLGLDHHVIDCPGFDKVRKVSPESVRTFEDLYERNVSESHAVWAPIAYAMTRDCPPNRVFVKGNVSEVARCSFYKHGYPAEVNPRTLCQVTGMMQGENPLPFAESHFKQWLDDALPVANRYGYEILDLFYWEQRMGRWQAQDQTERDIAQEVYTPYNCRSLLLALLGVDAIHRRGGNRLYRDMIKKLWVKVLDERFNPPPRFPRLDTFIGQSRVRLGRVKLFLRRVYRRPQQPG